MGQFILLPALSGTRFRDDYGAIFSLQTAMHLNRSQNVLPLPQYKTIAISWGQGHAN